MQKQLRIDLTFAFSFVCILYIVSLGIILDILWKGIPQRVFRDSASFAVDLIHEKIAQGFSLEEAFRVVTREFREQASFSAALLLDENGQIFLHEGNCSPNAEVQPLSSLSPYESISVNVLPLEHRSLCKEGESRYSGAVIKNQNFHGYLLLVGPHWNLQSFLGHIFAGHSLLLCVFLFPIAILAGWMIVARRVFQRFLLSDIRKIADHAYEFAIGKYDVNSLSSKFDDLLPLSSTLQTLGRRKSAKLGALKADTEERENIIAGLTHDLRTPLTVIEGSIERLREREYSPVEAEECASRVRGSLLFQRRIASQLKDLSEIQDPIKHHEFQPIEVASLLESCRTEFSVAAEMRKIQLSLRSLIDKSTVQGNSELLRRAIGNLFDNALKYTPQGGQVEILLLQDDDGVLRLQFISSPPKGMRSPSAPPRIKRERIERTGLGHAIVSRIMALHSGELGYETMENNRVKAELRFLRNRPEEPTNQQISPYISSEKTAFLTLDPQGPSHISLGIAWLTSLGTVLLQAFYGEFDLSLLFGISALMLLSQVAHSSTQKKSQVFAAVAAMLLFYVGAFHEQGEIRAFAGNSAFSSLFLIVEARSIRTQTFALIAFIGAAISLSPDFSPLLLGALNGLWMALSCIVLHRVPRWKRLSWWLASIVFFGVMIVFCAQSVMTYFATNIALTTISQEHSRPLSLQVEDLEARLVKTIFINPFADYLTRQGPRHSLISSYSFTPIAQSDIDEFRDSRAIQQTLRKANTEWLADGATIEVLYRRLLLHRLFCSNEVCTSVFVRFPTQLAEQALNRIMQGVMLFAGIFQIGLPLIMVNVLRWRWDRIIQAKVQVLERAMDSFRSGNYYDLSLEPGDDFYRLGHALEIMARSIQSHEEELHRRQSSLSKFLRLASLEVFRSVDAVYSFLGSCQLNDSGQLAEASRLVRGLSLDLDLVFSTALLQCRNSSFTSEHFSISELVKEELETFQQAVGRESLIEGDIQDGCFANTSPQLLVQLLRCWFLVCKMNASSGRSHLLKLSKSDSALVLSIEPKPEMLQPLADPMHYLLFATAVLENGIVQTYNDSNQSGQDIMPNFELKLRELS